MLYGNIWIIISRHMSVECNFYIFSMIILYNVHCKIILKKHQLLGMCLTHRIFYTINICPFPKKIYVCTLNNIVYMICRDFRSRQPHCDERYYFSPSGWTLTKSDFLKTVYSWLLLLFLLYARIYFCWDCNSLTWSRMNWSVQYGVLKVLHWVYSQLNITLDLWRQINTKSHYYYIYNFCLYARACVHICFLLDKKAGSI